MILEGLRSEFSDILKIIFAVLVLDYISVGFLVLHKQLNFMILKVFPKINNFMIL